MSKDELIEILSVNDGGSKGNPDELTSVSPESLRTTLETLGKVFSKGDSIKFIPEADAGYRLVLK